MIQRVALLLMLAPTLARADQPQPEPSAEGSQPSQEDAAPSSGSQVTDEEPASDDRTDSQTVSVQPDTGQPGTVSVDFKDADIRQVLRVLSLKSGVDIVAGPDVEGLITIKLTQVPWEQALDIILRTYGLIYERKANVIRVMTLAAVEQEAVSTEVFPLSYAKSKEVVDIVKEMLTDRGKVKYDERTNTVIVSDIPSTLFQLKSVVERLDRQTPQIHIESKFVETRLTRDENLGIDWFNSIIPSVLTATAPTTFPFPEGAEFGDVGSAFIPRSGTFSPSTGAALTRGRVPGVGGEFRFGTINMGTLTMTLNMLKQRVDTKVLSNPTIVTLNNKQANIQIGTDVNIPNYQIDPSTGRTTITGFQTRSTGIILKVTPYVNPQEEVVLDIEPEITTVGSNREFQSGSGTVTFPDFDVQKAKTQVRLKDSETLAIGGLKRQAERVTKSGVPILSDIPVVGWLFTNRQEQTPSGQDQLDLLIFLTVRLIRDPASPTTVAAQPARP